MLLWANANCSSLHYLFLCTAASAISCSIDLHTLWGAHMRLHSHWHKLWTLLGIRPNQPLAQLAPFPSQQALLNADSWRMSWRFIFSSMWCLCHISGWVSLFYDLHWPRNSQEHLINFSCISLIFRQWHGNKSMICNTLLQWDFPLSPHSTFLSSPFLTSQIVGIKHMMRRPVVVRVYLYKENHRSGLLRQLQTPRRPFCISSTSQC